MPLRVGYVREHFSSPLLQYAQDDKDSTFILVECPSGTGQLISRLTNDEIDVAIALTDPLISGIAKGSVAYRLVGTYVTTPLNWAIITGKDSKFNDIADLKGTTLGISRNGSGSQTMAYVMGLQNGWPPADLKFQVNNDIRGLIDSVNDGSTSAFMWEWFTTKPYADTGDVRFIGSVPTPWPSWLIAAHPSETRAPTAALNRFLNALTGYIRSFDADSNRFGNSLDFIQEKFGYPEEDIKESWHFIFPLSGAWLKTVGYPDDCAAIPAKTITDTLNTLVQAGVIQTPQGGFDVKDFVNTDIVMLT